MSETLEVFEFRLPMRDLSGLAPEEAEVAEQLLACQRAARQDGREWTLYFTEWGPFAVQWRDSWARRMHPEYILANSGGRESDAALRALARAGDAWGWVDEPPPQAKP